MWCYSVQFEIGPLSEGSIGAIQSQFPEQGFVDHAITPAIGMAWMIAEDTVDRYIIEPIEARTGNRYVRLLVRSGLNPSRTFANFLNGHPPWSRDSRAGISSYERLDPHFGAAISQKTGTVPAQTADFDWRHLSSSPSHSSRRDSGEAGRANFASAEPGMQPSAWRRPGNWSLNWVDASWSGSKRTSAVTP